MKTLIRRFFLDNWQRKLVAVLLSIIIWFMVNQSLTISRTIGNIPVRVVNIPSGETIIDLQANGTLTKRVALTFVGNKTLLDELSPADLEVVIDAQGKKGEWIASISKRNLVSLSPELNIGKGITRVSPTNVIIRLTKLITDKIPVYITQPIGQPPRGYQYLDIWPYRLDLTISGAEEVIKRLKSKGIRLTFDLSDITKAELDGLSAKEDSKNGDEVSFYIPEQWKRVEIPLLSERPIEINDPRAKDLRIDFVRISLIPVQSEVPINLYFPSEGLKKYSPKNVTVGSSPLIKQQQGVNLFSKPLFVKGVSPLFVRIVQQMLQLTIVVDPIGDTNELHWGIEFINPRLLEDQYVAILMSTSLEKEVRDLQPLLREEYLRNRFRSFMSRFKLYLSEDEALKLSARLDKGRILLEDSTPSSPSSTLLKKEL